MSTETLSISRLTAEASPIRKAIATSIVVVGLLGSILAIATLFTWIGLDTHIAGISVTSVFAFELLVIGIAILGCGIASRLDLLGGSPDATAGFIPAVLFGVIGFCAGGFIGSYVFSLGLAGWILIGGIGGGLAAILTFFLREDLASTVVPGMLAIGAGGSLLLGRIGPSWALQTNLSATLSGPILIPFVVIFCSLLVIWAGVKVYAGFGSIARQQAAFFLLGLNIAGMLAILVLLLWFILRNGLSAVFSGIQIGPGLQFRWPFVMNGYTLLPDVPNGIFPAVVGTVWLVIGTLIISVPIGVGAAVFLTKYAPKGRFVQLVEIATNGLWSTPSIVFGLFGFAFIVPRLGNTPSLLAGIIVVSFMLLPLVLITSREALETVPDEYRDASTALGANQWQTIRNTVLPAAIPGIITGIILGVGRIAGETAAILLVMTSGLRDPAPDVIGSFHFTTTPPFVANDALLHSATALPYQLYANITAGVNSGISNWGTALVLLLVVLSFYLIGITSRVYFERKLQL